VPALAAVLFFAGFAAPTLAASDPGAMKVAGTMTDAHGGMKPWADAPSVLFTDEWIGMGGATRTLVEQGRRRAYLDAVDGSSTIGWDGEKAWSVNMPPGTPPRFLALLNYYFLNLPWLVHDPGVNLGAPETGTLNGDPTQYITIMMTFESGVGDTPDDYYRLYIHPETHELKACAYTVTYKALLPEGVKSTPENTLVFDAWTTVSGLKVPTAFTIYKADHSVYAKCAIRDWSFSEPFDAARMTMPEGAVVDESQP
jgi:hypothetical protein